MNGNGFGAAASAGAGAASMVGSLIGLEKATIMAQGGGGLGGVLGGGRELRCSFNPKEIRVACSAQWNRTPRPAWNTSEAQYIGSNPRTISMQLFFDEWESIAGDVTDDIETLVKWTRPTEESARNSENPAPPLLRFSWGSARLYEWDVFLRQVTATFTLFRRNGVPVRATADVELEEVWSPQRATPPTNPTSGGVRGRRSHVVAGGDTLHSIAYREYGNPSYWRGLATINEIDDPLRLRPGTVLLIPPASEAAGPS